MLEQLRRRTARRSTPVAPHPELTPQQRQHIIERSNSTGSMAATTANAAASPVLNYRHVHTNVLRPEMRIRIVKGSRYLNSTVYPIYVHVRLFIR